nr:MAG TPA: hypothetical protein [Caudoviricetes sp.]DAI03258.1 MAG TPA: hypothetical protein [Caudoviricetes sp.]DAS13384.1 MAG TPA: hypothetical protein [Caudoviricetes sp.]DAS54295.1 MAG TPA: hypothetical protein [Caudoviricetes sp.]DAX26085.1 MAG TPA: hypothetical protein [Caudoviricetes sp.]
MSTRAPRIKIINKKPIKIARRVRRKSLLIGGRKCSPMFIRM